MTGDPAIEERFLILAPTGRDAELTRRLLGEAGLASEVCADIDELLRRAAEGAAGIFVADEALVPPAWSSLRQMLATQPTWSDLPVGLFTSARRDEEPAIRAEALGIAVVLERPVRPVTMISAARSALRVRRRQYAARAELAAQQRAVRERDEFLAMLGHELRNPLSAITMSLELMGPEGADCARCWTIVRRQADKLSRLVDDLLDVSRVTSGKINLRRERLDLAQITRRSVLAQQRAADDARLELTSTIPPGPVFVTGDAVRLEQVLGNLLTNAIKYTPPGGHVHVSLATGADDVQLRVVDDGAGIAPEMLPRIFDPFSQASTTLDRAAGGLGIGLTLVRSLVEHHGGKVVAESGGVGRGSSFTVTLPRRQEVLPTAADAPPGADRGHATRRVLVVEDDRDCREILETLLELDGHEVDSVGDGRAALELAAEGHPDVMIIDIGLPGMDGYEVARMVRARSRDVYLIALTGYGQPRDRERAFQAGFHQHFTKPVDTTALRRVLSQLELSPE